MNDSGTEITFWRTAGTPKSLDIDGDNQYGTFGRIFCLVGTVGNVTLTAFGPGTQAEVGPFPGYALVDSPTTPGLAQQVRTTTNNAIAGSDVVLATFRVDQTVAPNEILRVGIALDGLDDAQFTGGTIGLQEAGGSSVEVATPANSTIDLYFFDITGGVPASTEFDIFGDTGTSDFITHSFVTLDVVVIPEPSSLALLGLSGLLIARRRRRG